MYPCATLKVLNWDRLLIHSQNNWSPFVNNGNKFVFIKCAFYKKKYLNWFKILISYYKTPVW